MKINQY